MKYLLIALLIVFGCNPKNECGKEVAAVTINVMSEGKGFDMQHIDSCGNNIRTFHYEGKFDGDVIMKMMEGVSKDVPIKINEQP